MPSYSEYLEYLTRPEVRATLDTIAWAEGADYNVKFGGGRFSGNQHPNDCIPFRDTCSTAAGRYQFLYSTWRGLGLPDFSPTNQDVGALMLIRGRGALDEILAGDFAGALRSGALGREWASLPYSPYGQTNRSEASVLNYYNSALAALGGSGAVVPVDTGGGSSIAGSTSNYLLYGLAAVLFILLIQD